MEAIIAFSFNFFLFSLLLVSLVFQTSKQIINLTLRASVQDAQLWKNCNERCWGNHDEVKVLEQNVKDSINLFYELSGFKILKPPLRIYFSGVESKNLKFKVYICWIFFPAIAKERQRNCLGQFSKTIHHLTFKSSWSISVSHIH